MGKYVSACASLRPGQLERLVSKIKYSKPKKARLKVTLSFTLEYDVNEKHYPENCETLEDYIAVDKASIEEDYSSVLESSETEMNVAIREVKNALEKD